MLPCYNKKENKFGAYTWICINYQYENLTFAEKVCWNGVKCAQRLKVGQTTKQVTIKSEQWMVYVLSY